MKMSDERVKLDERTEDDFIALERLIKQAAANPRPYQWWVDCEEALARIRAKLEEAIEASQGGHVQLAKVREAWRKFNNGMLPEYNMEQCLADIGNALAECSPSLLPQNAREKVREALAYCRRILTWSDHADGITAAQVAEMLESALAEPEPPHVDGCGCSRGLQHPDPVIDPRCEALWEPEEGMPSAMKALEQIRLRLERYDRQDGYSVADFVNGVRCVLDANFTGYRGKR